MTNELHRRVEQAAAAIVAGRVEMRRAGGNAGALHDALLGQLEVVEALEPRTAAAFAAALFNHLGHDDHDLAMEWAQYALLYHGGAVRRPFTPEEIVAAVETNPAGARPPGDPILLPEKHGCDKKNDTPPNNRISVLSVHDIGSLA